MGATEQTVLSLLATMERCRRAVAGHAAAFRLGHDFGSEPLFFSQLLLDRDGGPLRIAAFAEVRVLLGGAESNDVYFRLALETAEAGLRVCSRVEAHLDAAMGDCRPGSHVLYENRSAVLTFDDAVAEAQSQAAAFDGTVAAHHQPLTEAGSQAAASSVLPDYPHRLGLRPTGPAPSRRF